MLDDYIYSHACFCPFRQSLSSLPKIISNMSNNINEKPDSSAKEFEDHRYEVGHDTEKTGYDKSGAVDAENIEHEMTVMQAVKAYPAASWWAFVMSSTIVSSHLHLDVGDNRADATIRSWSHTASS